eukprot:TRINITY_DN48221_c0_g1_i1.p1 TRINITY_DN48221_c0_g1~~TRINITY_DN48221_c0_g1_i1.p1  ORF type:complete len:532 (-),score=38.43 TRINITY_DN48221_c0_g1_i1:191-1786(-)
MCPLRCSLAEAVGSRIVPSHGLPSASQFPGDSNILSISSLFGELRDSGISGDDYLVGRSGAIRVPLLDGVKSIVHQCNIDPRRADSLCEGEMAALLGSTENCASSEQSQGCASSGKDSLRHLISGTRFSTSFDIDASFDAVEGTTCPSVMSVALPTDLTLSDSLVSSDVGLLLPYGEKSAMSVDGSPYTGQFKNGLRHGIGSLVSRDGLLKYEGEWRDGLRHGNGRCTYDVEGAASFQGQWFQGKKHGQGTQVWPSGSIYSGQWRMNLMHGNGVMRWFSDHHVEVWGGIWHEGEARGPCDMKFACEASVGVSASLSEPAFVASQGILFEVVHEADVFGSLDSWEFIGSLQVGDLVVVTGEPHTCEGYAMVQIKPRGYVDVNALERAVPQCESVHWGTALVASSKAVVFSSITSRQPIGSVEVGTTIIADGPVETIEGPTKSLMMVPIKPCGAVELSSFSVREPQKPFSRLFRHWPPVVSRERQEGEAPAAASAAVHFDIQSLLQASYRTTASVELGERRPRISSDHEEGHL